MDALKQVIKLLIESAVGSGESFALLEPTTQTNHDENFTIVREFSLNGGPESDHEIGLDVDFRFQRSTFGGSMTQPPDPDEFDIDSWEPVSIDGMSLSQADAKRLYDYLGGELYEEEKIALERQESERDNFIEPDEY